MPTASAFDYAIIRVVPSVEREEYINAGVILFCPERSFLGARVELDAARLAALYPRCNAQMVRAQLDLIPQISEGAGPIGRLSLSERFHWLVSPRSTVIQVSPVHCGLCADPAAMLEAPDGDHSQGSMMIFSPSRLSAISSACLNSPRGKRCVTSGRGSTSPCCTRRMARG